MNKKIILLFFLGYVCGAQAHPENGFAPKRNDKHSCAVQKCTSAPQLNSHIALVFDVGGQHALYAKNAENVVPIASISKLMMSMVVLDAQLPMDEPIRITSKDIDTLKGSSSRLLPGMTLTRGELLKLALMSSENRAAAALARTYPGGTAAVVARMNARARVLGMKDTRFLDPTGLNCANVSTAQDLVKLVLAAQNYRPIHQATTTSFRIVAQSGHRALMYGNTNPLVRSPSWEIGVSKTGYINEAGHCLVMQAKIKQHPVVIILLNSDGKETRIADANRVKRWIERA